MVIEFYRSVYPKLDHRDCPVARRQLESFILAVGLQRFPSIHIYFCLLNQQVSSIHVMTEVNPQEGAM